MHMERVCISIHLRIFARNGHRLAYRKRRNEHSGPESGQCSKRCKKGRSIEEIADCVDSDAETVKKWITARI